MAKSIMVSIDGSQESLFAADIASSLAQRKATNLTGLTVVDSESLWQIIGQDLPGIIGSGPYLAAFQSVETALHEIAETLMVAFESRIEGKQINARTEVANGNIIEEIVSRSSEYDLVVMGHKSKVRQRHLHQSRYINTSLCQRVAEMCPVPLLLVQGLSNLWSRSVLLVSIDTYCSDTVRTFVELTSSSSGSVEIVCTGRSKTIDDLLKIVRADVNETPFVKASHTNTVSIVGRKLYELEKFFAMSDARRSETLVVLTTCDTEQGRKVCTGESLDYVIKDLVGACTLFLPPSSSAKQVRASEPAKLTASAGTIL